MNLYIPKRDSIQEAIVLRREKHNHDDCTLMGTSNPKNLF